MVLNIMDMDYYLLYISFFRCYGFGYKRILVWWCFLFLDKGYFMFCWVNKFWGEIIDGWFDC